MRCYYNTTTAGELKEATCMKILPRKLGKWQILKLRLRMLLGLRV
ncbi:hypothetical protein ACFLVU_03425 [Chloroflexota bacterium]